MGKRVLFFLVYIAISLSAGSFEQLKTDCLLKLKLVQDSCPAHKAIKMMDLIYKIKPNLCVELGVFSGSSILPQAEALKFNNRGVIYAIDPWDKEACLTGYEPNDPNYVWWSNLDLEGVYYEFMKMLRMNELSLFCKVIRRTSANALKFFEDESIDILHIDGNHVKDRALTDARMYLQKVKSGGYIWLDNANKTTAFAAIDYLVDHCKEVDEYSCDEYVLFQKIQIE